MIVRISEMYEDDWDVTDYEEGEYIRLSGNAIRANFVVLEDEDQDHDDTDRCGSINPDYVYQLRDGKLMAEVDGHWLPYEDEWEFEQALEAIESME